MRCRALACAAQLRYGVMKENLYFWATLAMAARSAGLSGRADDTAASGFADFGKHALHAC